MTAVKICGVTRPEDARLAARLGGPALWAVGVVFAPGSPRRVGAALAARIRAALPDAVRLVGVFMDQPLDYVLRTARRGRLDLLQFHGAEGTDYLRAAGPERCVKAWVLRGPGSLRAAERCPAAWLLVDRPRDARGPRGRTGRGAAARLARRRRLLLAGGLTSATVGAAIGRVRPWGVDVSSGVESSPGLKDPGRLREFFSAVKGARA